MKRVYIDMDGVLCDFKGAVRENLLKAANEKEENFPQSRQGFFILLKPIEGAIEAVSLLRKHYDVYILTRPSFYNLHCYTEKAIWVRMHLGYEMQKRLMIVPNKSFVEGDYLIDDMLVDGQSEFKGKLLHFGHEYPSWKECMAELVPNEPFKILAPH